MKKKFKNYHYDLFFIFIMIVISFSATFLLYKIQTNYHESNYNLDNDKKIDIEFSIDQNNKDIIIY